MKEQNTTDAAVKMLSLAVKALIETHPDKESLKKLFLGYVDKPETAGDYTAGLGQMDQDVRLLQSLLRSASGAV
ncbi:MAG: hypothetical protein WBA83_16955 [Burkholderiaceae bacterium]